MKKIFVHIEFTRVGHYQSILEDSDIRTYVKNKDSAVGMGEIPFTEVWPELWVVNDDDFDKAVNLLEEVTTALEETIEPWECPNCHEQIEEGFGECWNCSTLKP